MSISAGLEWVGNIAAGAQRDADAVAALNAQLRALQGLSGAGGNIGLGNVAAQATALQAAAARSVAAQGQMAVVAAKAQAQIQVIQAKAAAAHVGAVDKLIEAQGKDASKASLAQIQAAQKAAIIEQQGAQKAALIRQKSAADMAKAEHKAAIDAAKDVRKAWLASTKGSQGQQGGGGGGQQGGGGGQDPRVAAAQKAQEVLGKVESVIKSAATAVAGLIAATAAATGAALYAGAKLSIETAGAKKNLMTSLELMLGTKDAAAQTYAEIKQFAAVTPFETKDVATYYKSLLSAGFDKAKTKDVLAGVLDVSALQDFDTNVAHSLVLAISQIRGKGRLMSEELNQLIEGSGGVISRTKVYEQLSKVTGKSLDETIKLLETGKIDSKKGVDAILEVIRTSVSGGKLGKLSERMGLESVTGLTSTIKDSLTSMFEDVDISPLTKTLTNVSTALSGPEGERLSNNVRDLFTSVFEAIFGPLGDEDGAKKIERIVGKLADAAGEAKDAVQKATPAIKAFVNLLTKLLGGEEEPKEPSWIASFTTVGPVIDSAVAQFQWAMGMLNPSNALAALGDFGSRFMTIGGQMVDGLVSGISAGAQRVLDAITGVVGGAVSQAKRLLGIASPSRVFASIGGFTAEGMALGISREAAQVEHAVTMMARDATLAASMPMRTAAVAAPKAIAATATGTAGAIGTALANLTIQPGAFVVHMAGGEDPEAMAARLWSAFRAHLVAELRAVAVEGSV